VHAKAPNGWWQVGFCTFYLCILQFRQTLFDSVPTRRCIFRCNAVLLLKAVGLNCDPLQNYYSRQLTALCHVYSQLIVRVKSRIAYPLVDRVGRRAIEN
jgi:hypothetical protein